MSSTLKVDILQDSGGNNLVTSNGSGVITAAGFGKIGQVVQATTTTEANIATQTFTDTNLSGTITPSSTSSKILVSIQQAVHLSRANTAVFVGWRLLRGSTEIFNPSPADGSSYFLQGIGVGGSGTTTLNLRNTISYTYLDSPATTSATTYKTQGTCYYTTNSAFVRFQENESGADAASVITLMEVLP